MTVPIVASRGGRLLRRGGRLRYGLALAVLGVAGAVGIATAASVPPPAPEPLALPVSFLDLMRATFDPTAGGIWIAQAEEALADEDWLLVEKDAVELAAATTLLSGAGAGEHDAAWAAAPDWRAWTRELQLAALQIRAAAAAKDVDQLNAAADQMSDLCLACHGKYQTQAPADGVTRYPFYPARVRGQ